MSGVSGTRIRHHPKFIKSTTLFIRPLFIDEIMEDLLNEPFEFEEDTIHYMYIYGSVEISFAWILQSRGGPENGGCPEIGAFFQSRIKDLYFGSSRVPANPPAGLDSTFSFNRQRQRPQNEVT